MLARSLRGGLFRADKGELTVSKVTTLVRTLVLSSDRLVFLILGELCWCIATFLYHTQHSAGVEVAARFSVVYKAGSTVTERLKRLLVSAFNTAMRLH
jgi:hypothetical protein